MLDCAKLATWNEGQMEMRLEVEMQSDVASIVALQARRDREIHHVMSSFLGCTNTAQSCSDSTVEGINICTYALVSFSATWLKFGLCKS